MLMQFTHINVLSAYNKEKNYNKKEKVNNTKINKKIRQW